MSRHIAPVISAGSQARRVEETLKYEDTWHSGAELSSFEGPEEWR